MLNKVFLKIETISVDIQRLKSQLECAHGRLVSTQQRKDDKIDNIYILVNV